MKTPRELDYRLPAEWEPQQAVWLSWPVDRSTWPGAALWQRIQKRFAEMAVRFSQHQPVLINICQEKRRLTERLLKEVRVESGLTRGEFQFFDHPVNDVWVRDHGPVYIKHKHTGEIALTDWQFNGWGCKFPHELDNRIPARIQSSTGLPSFRVPLVLEGGSIECNGVGDLLVTRDCLSNPNRNPTLTEGEIAEFLRAFLGVEKVHWLEGCIEGDDTDGHIDNLVRFFRPDGVLVAVPSKGDRANRESLDRLWNSCREVRLHNGSCLDMVPLPLPAATFQGGHRLPMSYLNFFIGNREVFVPSYGQPPNDKAALETIGSVFPDREAVSIDCRDIILEGGALHCLTQQVPQTP